MRLVERDGDETRTRGVDLLTRRENETGRSKEKAGSSSLRDEDPSNRGRERDEREKRRRGMRRTRERKRERLGGRRMGQSRGKERWEEEERIERGWGIMVEEGQKVSRSAEEASSRSWSYL